MDNKNNIINIAYCTDANYLEYVAVSIMSVIMNNPEQDLSFFVFVYDVTDEEINKLRSTSDKIQVISIDKEEIEKLVKIFAAGKPTSQKMNCSMVGEYASNICRMWILSDNPDVLSFMTQREFRLAVFSGDQPGIESLRAAVQYTHFSNYDYVDLSIFSVPWARNKGVMFNTPGAYARLKKLVEEASS